MSGEIIRMGDPTSHGGSVIEGSMADICHGRPIAFVGHQTVCPKCKGTFPIIEGAPTTTFYGKGVALARMRTACGAVLIATQFSERSNSVAEVAVLPGAVPAPTVRQTFLAHVTTCKCRFSTRNPAFGSRCK